MAAQKLADRVAAVEKEIEQLKQEFKAEKSQENVPWYDKIFGTFKDDPDYDEAMRLGREYRRLDGSFSLRLKDHARRRSAGNLQYFAKPKKSTYLHARFGCQC